MRKAIIAAIVATALFAVGAFAASFTVEAEDIASGADGVDACATHVDITFETIAVTTVGATQAEWKTTTATATFYLDDDDTAAVNLVPAVACNGADARLALVVDGVTKSTYVPDGQVSDADVQFTVDEFVAGITKASVVVGGQTLNAEIFAPTP